MSTRALIVVYDTDDTEICVIYNHWDGAIQHLGYKIARFLSERPIVNGIPALYEFKGFNGMGCLAASLIKELKTGAGNVYIYPTGTRDVGEEFIYHIKGRYNDISATIKVDIDNDDSYLLLNCKGIIDFDAFREEDF